MGQDQVAERTEASADHACVICGAARDTFRDLTNRPKAGCMTCYSLERHRAFAHAYRDSLEAAGGFAGLRVLVLRPDKVDRIMLEAFGAAEVVGFDAMPGRPLDAMGDPAKLEFADDSFDVIIGHGVLASYRDPEAAIAELGRVLKRTGLAFFYEGPAVGKPSVQFEDRETQASWYGEEMLDTYGVGRFRAWGLRDLEQALGAAFRSVRLLETEEPYSGKAFLWCVAAHGQLPGEMFTDRALLMAAHGGEELRADPPYECPLCEQVFDALAGYDCPHCKRPTRTRSLPELVRRHLKPLVDPELAARLPLLAVSMDKVEQKVLDEVFSSYRRISLFGDYADDNTSGIDVRDLGAFADNAFSGAFALAVFDYFVEQEQALREFYRVIAPGGVAAILIQPARLRSGLQPPSVNSLIQHKEGIDYYPPEVQLVSIAVGRQWYLEAMRRIGFEASMAHVFDPPTGVTHTWFLGRKPA